jgi:hypothetical protein
VISLFGEGTRAADAGKSLSLSPSHVVHSGPLQCVAFDVNIVKINQARSALCDPPHCYLLQYPL